jgi:hypothetical protein
MVCGIEFCWFGLDEMKLAAGYPVDGYYGVATRISERQTRLELHES